MNWGSMQTAPDARVHRTGFDARAPISRAPGIGAKHVLDQHNKHPKHAPEHDPQRQDKRFAWLDWIYVHPSRLVNTRHRYIARLNRNRFKQSLAHQHAIQFRDEWIITDPVL